MAEEIGELDLTAQADAAKTASNFITEVTNSGIMVADQGKGTTDGVITPNTTGWHLSDTLELIKDGITTFKVWLNEDTTKMRIGNEDSNHITLDDTGMKIFDYNDNTATFNKDGIEIGTQYHVQILSDGMHIIDPADVVVASYGKNSIIGPSSDFHLSTTGNRMEFWQGNTLVSYINNNQMKIPSIVVDERMEVGNWTWIHRANGHLSLVWIGGDE